MIQVVRASFVFVAITGATFPSASGQELFLNTDEMNIIAGIAAFFQVCNGDSVRDEVLDYYYVTKKSQGTPSDAADLQRLMVRGRIATDTIDPARCTDEERRQQANLLKSTLEKR